MLPLTLAALGSTEVLLILAIVVIFFGAAKIPELARSLGRAKGEFEKGARESREEMARAESEDERILRAAKELGIPTEGRPLADVKRDLKARMS
jgi:sec-independent protein translocase protein TatA